MIQQALDNATLVKSDLWSINNIFTDIELSDLLDKIELEKNWQTVDLQENLPRRSLQWVDNGLLDHVWTMINQLNFSSFGLKFRNVDIWKDVAPYCIKDHVDNDRVVAAMQIYLNSGPENLGTWFQDSYIPFVANTGYIMNNKNKLVHGMKTAVPDNFVRYSLYALFDTV
jgi:hypothetical protein